MKFAFFLFKNHKGLFALSSLIGLISGGANIMLLAIISKNLALYQAGESSSAGVAIFGWVALGAILTGIFSGLMNLFISTKLSLNLQLNMASQILQLSLLQKEKAGDARLLTTFTQDIPAIIGAVMAIPGLFLNTGMTLGGLIYLGWLSPPVLFGLFVYIVFCIISFLIPEKKQIQLSERTRAAWDYLIAQFNALNQGAKELRLHYRRRESFFNQIFRQTAASVQRNTRLQGILGQVVGSWIGLTYFLFIGFLIFIVPRQWDLDLVTLVSYALVVLFIRTPVMALVGSRQVFRSANIAFHKTEQVGLMLMGQALQDPFSDKPAVIEQIDGLPPFRSLQIKQGVHRFHHEDEDRPFTLGPIDFSLHAGELVFLIGGNGSGKTTLAKMITGLYIPQSGQIMLNGEPVTEEHFEPYRQHFSAIFSDFYLFEQLLGFDHRSLDQKAEAYLKQLQLDRKVNITNGKFSTVHLSTGQRKRLALVTAYLEDRPVYLFDEWAADQDPEFKNIFYHQLLPDLKQKGKAVIVISHDDRYFDIADRIVKLEEGRLFEP